MHIIIIIIIIIIWILQYEHDCMTSLGLGSISTLSDNWRTDNYSSWMPKK